MNGWKPLIHLLLLFSLSGFAQTTPSSTFYADDLVRLTHEINISPRFNTIVIGYARISVLTAGMPENVTPTTLSPNIIQLNTTATSGEFGITLLIDGQPVSLRVKIIQSNFNRTISILPGTHLAATLANRPAPTTSGTTTKQKVQSSAAPQTAPTQAPATPPAQAPVQPTPPSAPAPSQPVTTGAGAGTMIADKPSGLPNWIKSDMTARQSLSGNGLLTVKFDFENLGINTISIDVVRLFVRQNGRELRFTITRLEPSALLEPNDTQTGSLMVENAAAGRFEIEWTIVEITPDNPQGKTYLLRQVFNAPTAP